jgi:hypothetical protein
MSDNLANWPVGTTWPSGYFFANSPWRVMIYEGVASGSNFVISGNSPNTFSGWNSLSIVPASGDKYVVFQNTGDLTGYYPSGYFPPYSRDYIQTTVGCYSVTDTARKDTTTTYLGGSSMRLFGPGFQEFNLPVSGSNGLATNLNVYSYFDDFYSGVKPQMLVLNGAPVSVNDATGTVVGNSGQWEQISLTIYPTGAGVVKVRFQSDCTSIGGSAYFDKFTVT